MSKVLDRFVVRRSNRRMRAVVVAAGLLAAGRSVHATTLTWDSTGTHGTNPTDGSGTWDDASVRWSTGATDQAWADGNNAVIGHGTGKVRV